MEKKWTSQWIQSISMLCTQLGPTEWSGSYQLLKNVSEGTQRQPKKKKTLMTGEIGVGCSSSDMIIKMFWFHNMKCCVWDAYTSYIDILW